MVASLLTDKDTVSPRFTPHQVSSLTLDREYVSLAANLTSITASTGAGEPAIPPFEHSRISPAWFAPQKERLRAFAALAENWDSYEARPVDSRALATAEGLLEWLALADVPPPDVLPTSDGGVQIEWHIYGVDAEVEISADETVTYFHDLGTREEWVRPLSSTWAELQTIRRRLLARNG